MAMTGFGLAERIRSDMGYPAPVSKQLIGWGTGVVEHIQKAAIVNHLPGTITGVTAAGSSLAAGAGLPAGIISAMSGSEMAELVVRYAGYGSVSEQLRCFCGEIVRHIETQGKVKFDSGNITGQCTSTLLSPGPLVGAGNSGDVVFLSGVILANNVHSHCGYPGSVSQLLIKFCTAVTNYIMENADVSYKNGQVTGVCPPSAGPLAAGTGINGKIN